MHKYFLLYYFSEIILPHFGTKVKDFIESYIDKCQICDIIHFVYLYKSSYENETLSLVDLK